MPSRARNRARLLVIAIALGCGASPWHAAAQGSGGTVVSDLEVDRAVALLVKDPNLAAERKIRMLKFKTNDNERESQPEKSGFLRWLGEFFGWFASGARWLLWLLIAVLVGFLLVYLARLFIERRSWTSAARTLAPTHVQDLDIRPESLPDDVGAAARALWDRGEHRAALSLLYRGTLSRLVHVHEIEIRNSSTEGDCLELAARSLAIDRLNYVIRLIRAWQRAVYGGVDPTDEIVRELCAEFSGALDASPRPPPFVANGAAEGAT